MFFGLLFVEAIDGLFQRSLMVSNLFFIALKTRVSRPDSVGEGGEGAFDALHFAPLATHAVDEVLDGEAPALTDSALHPFTADGAGQLGDGLDVRPVEGEQRGEEGVDGSEGAEVGARGGDGGEGSVPQPPWEGRGVGRAERADGGGGEGGGGRGGGGQWCFVDAALVKALAALVAVAAAQVESGVTDGADEGVGTVVG